MLKRYHFTIFFAFAVVSSPLFAQAVSSKPSQGNLPQASAADPMGRLQNLIATLRALDARVAKLEGNIGAADIVGRYAISQFQTELNGGGSIRNYTGGGVVTFAADGTGSLTSNVEIGHQLSLPAASLSAIDLPQQDFTFTWSYANGTINAIDGLFYPVAGGRLLIRASANTLDGTNVMLLLTRIN